MKEHININNRFLIWQFDFLQNKCIVFCSLLLLILPKYVWSQTIYLKPYAGGKSLLCSYDKKIGSVSTFKINSFQLATDFGLLINYRVTHKLSISTGIRLSQTGWSYSMKIPSGLVRNPYGSIKAGHSEAIVLHRFPFLLQYSFAEARFLKNKNGDVLKTILYKINGGVNIDNAPNVNNFDETPAIWTYNGDTIKYTNKANYNPHKHIGVSATVGLSLCLHNKIKNKDILELTFFYDQGLINIMSVDVTYQLNGIHSHSRLYTKGTDYGFILCIPIRVYNKS